MNFLRYVLVKRRIAAVIYIVGAAMVWGDGSTPALIWGNMLLALSIAIHIRQTIDEVNRKFKQTDELIALLRAGKNDFA